MKKEKEEILEKLRDIKQKAEYDLKNNHPGYENCTVKNVIHYNKKVELINKESGEKEEFDLCVAIVEDQDTKQTTSMYYLDGEEVDFTELLMKYESAEPIKDVVDKTKENEEKPKKDQDKELVKDDLNELEKEKEQEEQDKSEKEDEKKEKKDEQDEEKSFKTDSAGAISLDNMVDGVTLRNILKLDGDYEYIKPVSASQVKGFAEGISNKDAVIAIKKNGECTILDENIIRPDRQEGNNSSDRDLNINSDGSVEYKSNTSSYQIVNKPGYYISIGYDEGSSKREIKLSRRSGRDGDEEVEFELQKKGAAEYEDPDARRLRQKNEDGIEKSEEIIDKQKEHEEAGCENDRVENIDNYEDNNMHEHFIIEEDSIVPGKDITFKEWAEEELGENVDVIIDRFNRELEKNPKADIEEISETIEDDYDRLPEHQR